MTWTSHRSIKSPVISLSLSSIIQAHWCVPEPLSGIRFHKNIYDTATTIGSGFANVPLETSLLLLNALRSVPNARILSIA